MAGNNAIQRMRARIVADYVHECEDASYHGAQLDPIAPNFTLFEAALKEARHEARIEMLEWVLRAHRWADGMEKGLGELTDRLRDLKNPPSRAT